MTAASWCSEPRANSEGFADESDGQLGSDLKKVFAAAGDEVIALTHAQMEVCNPEQVAAVVAEVQPQMVLNASAFHKVEECEKKPELAFHGSATMNLAQTCQGGRGPGSLQPRLCFWRIFPEHAIQGDGSSGAAECLRRLEASRRAHDCLQHRSLFRHTGSAAVRDCRQQRQRREFC